MRKRAVVQGLCLAILATTLPARAEVLSDFTFKRVKVGQGLPGRRRITVQIDPAEQAQLLQALPKVNPNPEHQAEVAPANTRPLRSGGPDDRAL